MRGNKSGKWQVTRKAESLDWDDLSRLRDAWPGKLVVKGILEAADAQEAVARGADGIVVSNHGGRNLDGLRAPVEVLADIAGCIKGKADILVDSGFMRGSDVVKALALGADAVMVGRAPLYGLAAGGMQGALQSLRFFREEIDRVLAFMGVRDVGALRGEHVYVGPVLG